ncbi:hypothetical protein M433DRAFT_176638 [Acidomyces richmondensis BFW]|nr:hypothetical protein M433DRAFT_176638 [Acidomyces richmondensis BFW]
MSAFQNDDGCEDCGSRKLKRRDDGYLYCHRGHQQTNRGVIVAEDTGELVITGRTTRRQGSDAESIATSRASGYSGPRAIEHYLLCLQLVLRKQLRWLIEVQNLPEELESVVHDLWSLRLRKIQRRILYDSDTETDGQSQLFSSQSEGETSASESSRRSHNKTEVKAGCLLLREPVTVADFTVWIRNGELLYYRASKDIPRGMRERLPATYQELLEPVSLGKPEKLHQYVLELLQLMHEEFGMAVPPLNHVLILQRWIRILTLPLEVFAATQRLARILELGFSFKFQTKESNKAKDLMLRYPETRLMALIIVATKLLFPFDDVKRYPTSPSDPSVLSMDWQKWQEIQSRPVRGAMPLSYQAAMNFSEEDALRAGDEELDAYLDWAEDNIASEEIRERGKAGKDADFRRALFKMFPSGRPSRHDGSLASELPKDSHDDMFKSKIRQVHAALKPQRIVEPREGFEDVDRTGSYYRRCKRMEELDGPMRMFYEKAGELAGVSLKSMVRAVNLVETRLQKHEEDSRQ